MATVKWETLRSVAHGSITNSYTTVGGVTQQNWRIMKIVNNTNGDLLFSTDGTHDMILVPASSFTLYDFATNGIPGQTIDNWVLAKQLQWYVKYSSAPSTGSAYIEGLYA